MAWYTFDSIKNIAREENLYFDIIVFKRSRSNLSWSAKVYLYKKVDKDFMLLECNMKEFFEGCGASFKDDPAFGWVFAGRGCGTERRFATAYELFQGLGLPNALKLANSNIL